VRRALVVVAAVPVLLYACAKGPDSSAAAKPAMATAPAPAGLCEHGVPAAVCTQCNPDIAPVFKAKGDWCDEHGVPESHCCIRCMSPVPP